MKKNKQKLVSNLGGLRPGMSVPEKTIGLRLSNISQQKLDFFKENPDNVVFEEMKSAGYLTSLEKDIATSGILHPLIATQSGLLIEGHSRYLIAKKLGLTTIPCRIILDDLTPQQLKERVYLGNLNRFEISADQRTTLFAVLYPDYFLESRDDLLIKTKPVKELAQEMGVTPRQVQRERKVVMTSLAMKKEVGDASPLRATDMQAARQELQRQKQRQSKDSKNILLAGLKRKDENSQKCSLFNADGVRVFSVNPSLFTSQEELNLFLVKTAMLYKKISKPQ